jgi:hypothetical protein
MCHGLGNPMIDKQEAAVGSRVSHKLRVCVRARVRVCVCVQGAGCPDDRSWQMKALCLRAHVYLVRLHLAPDLTGPVPGHVRHLRTGSQPAHAARNTWSLAPVMRETGSARSAQTAKLTRNAWVSTKGRKVARQLWRGVYTRGASTRAHNRTRQPPLPHNRGFVDIVCAGGRC